MISGLERRVRGFHGQQVFGVALRSSMNGNGTGNIITSIKLDISPIHPRSPLIRTTKIAHIEFENLYYLNREFEAQLSGSRNG
jgi:hypothetical protein